jgi:hypothetical protein
MLFKKISTESKSTKLTEGEKPTVQRITKLYFLGILIYTGFTTMEEQPVKVVIKS